jgi:hypothetical protein
VKKFQRLEVLRPAACALLLVASAAGAISCHRVSKDDAQRLVEKYNETVAEAYRRGDASLAEAVAGPDEQKKLQGLIGVRTDLGLTLDSQLKSLEVTGVEAAEDKLRVTTRETWHYSDRKIGSGEQVGEASDDRYEMLYLFDKTNRDWRVDELRFLAKPTVGRTQMTWAAGSGATHEVAPPAPAKEGAP